MGLPQPPSDQPNPVFITGSGRSGTSILTWAIGTHPRFRPLEETGWIGLYGTGALAGYGVASSAPRNFFAIYGVSLADYMVSIGASIDSFIRKASANEAPQTERRRWVDGTPENTNYMYLLRQMFPAAKFILLVRDPVETVASLVFFARAGGTARSINTAAREWANWTNRGLLAYRAFGPDVVKIVPYAELVHKPAVVLRSIFEFLGDEHAPEAELMMEQRINSSHVTREERESVQAKIERSGLGARLRRRYDEVLSAMEAPWSQDEGALRELESLQRLPTSTLASPRFAFVRWMVGRLREKIS